MANVWTNPWAGDSETRRAPTAGENSLGHVCGPADPDMENYMKWFLTRWCIETGLAVVIPMDSDDKDWLTKVMRAIADQRIAVSGGGGGGGGGLSLYNPVYPEVVGTTGRLTVNHAGGNLTIPNGQTIIHRGSSAWLTDDFDLATERTFATTANKTYHLRFDYNAGTPEFSLNDVAAAGYNPTALLETDAAFDSTYDSALLAKVVTDGANVATITTLINRDNLSMVVRVEDQRLEHTGGSEVPTALAGTDTELNWSRTPVQPDLNLGGFRSWGPSIDFRSHTVYRCEIYPGAYNRYGVGEVKYLYRDSSTDNGTITWTLNLEAAHA